MANPPHPKAYVAPGAVLAASATLKMPVLALKLAVLERAEGELNVHLTAEAVKPVKVTLI